MKVQSLKSVTSPLIFLIALSLGLFSCTEKKTVKEKPSDQLTLSKEADLIIQDTASVSPLVDSLKQKFLYSEANDQILILGELAESWRPNSFILASEELKQSSKLKFLKGEGDANCKLGIYYCRKFNFDSVDICLNKAIRLASKNNFDDLLAQAISWQAEALRQSGDNDKALETQDKAIEIASKINDKKRLAFCYLSKGEAYKIKSEFNKALDCYSKAVDFAIAANDLNKQAVCYNSTGDVYRTLNNYPVALKNFNKGLEIAKKNKNKIQIAYCLSCMGDIYSANNESKKAITYYEDAYTIAVETGLQLQQCNSLSSMGMAYYLLFEHKKAIECFNKALLIAEEIGNNDKMAFILSTEGELFQAQGDYAKALESLQKAADICKATGNKNQLATTYQQIGENNYHTGKFQEAQTAAQRSMELSKETRALEGIKNSAKLLASIHEIKNEPAKALKMLYLFIAMKDSIGNESQVKQFAAIEYKAKEDGLKAEQKAKEETYLAEQARKEEELKRQKTIRYAFTIGFALVLVLVVVVFRNLQVNKKKNRIITAQKKEVEHQKELVDEKNKEITDSITYAKRLQDAILPPVKLVRQYFPESFVYYNPKDIIAGDFYWMEHVGDVTFFAAADSTGHGVPGAMVSVVCSNALNRAIKEFKLLDPGKILDKTRELVLETFEKSEGEVKDGMDISLLSVDHNKQLVTWSGANNPLWYITNSELNSIKATKQPIGKTDNPQPFTTHNIPYVKGTIFYLLTDGYADQFGGPKGKKFKYKPLEDLLLSVADKSMPEQGQLLQSTFDEWKGNYDQVDDVTIIGVKL